MNLDAKKWWPAYKPRAGADARLFCIPPAGGAAAMFGRWQIDAMDVVAVELPGHGKRRREPPLTDWPTLVGSLTDAISTLTELPYALFGYSLGAKIAFEVSREFVRRGQSGPRHLFVSACSAPSTPPSGVRRGGLSKEEFVAELKQLGGTPDVVFSSPDVLELFLPIVQADFRLDEAYVWTSGPTLSCPISAFCGHHDPQAPPSTMGDWGKETSGGLAVEALDEGHFFLDSRRDFLTSCVAVARIST